MMLIIHIVIALSSVIFTAYVAWKPTESKLKTSYALIAATLYTGTDLVISSHQPLTQSCLTGLGYLAISGLGIFLAKRRLALQKI